MARGHLVALAIYPAGGNAMTIAGGDLNGDGRFDLVVTINQADIGLALLFGNGDGTLRRHRSICPTPRRATRRRRW